MKKVLIAVLTGMFILTNFVSAAEMTLTEFSVTGEKITAKGIIEGTENSRASIYIEKSGSGIYVGQAEADKDGSFDLSFTAPKSWTNGSYTAHIGATECAAQSVAFDFSGDKTYISYTPEENNEPGNTVSGIEFDAVKRISRVTVSGQVKDRKTEDDKVMLVVRREAALTVTEDDVAYIDQTALDSEGRFSFTFNFTGSLSDYAAYLYADGRNISDSIEVSHSLYEVITAEVEVSQTLNRAVLLAKLTNVSEEKVPYVMIIAMYDKDNVMVGMKAEDAVIAGQTSADDTIELVIPPETVKVKAMLWNSREEMLPIAKPAAMVP